MGVCDNPDDVTLVFYFHYRVDDRESSIVILSLPYLVDETFQFSRAFTQAVLVFLIPKGFDPKSCSVGSVLSILQKPQKVQFSSVTLFVLG